MSDTAIKNSYTPGPWDGSHGGVFPHKTIGADRPCGYWPIFKQHSSGGTKTVCTVPLSNEFDEEGRATAKLIAAAPDLLAALKYINEDHDFITRCSDTANALVEKAILKAEGATK